MMYRGIKMILKKFRELLLEDIYHKGALYCTFDSNDNPNGRLPGKWERLPDGVFIRNAGGNAGTVGNTQGESLPNIKGTVLFQTYSEDTIIQSATGAFKGRQGGMWKRGLSRIWDTYGITGFDFDLHEINTIYKDNAHVTPVNVALYMWRRTA